jgi:hypothetical protein
VTELVEKRRRNTSATAAAATSRPKRLQREPERERGQTEKPGQPKFVFTGEMKNSKIM